MNATTCFLAELVGTAILILLGNGVVAIPVLLITGTVAGVFIGIISGLLLKRLENYKI